ncbi:putative Alcohol dehydrogenase [Actinacidiphila bryophytorum]|uniref:Alcohol dehydrogenase n=1 Tax=Actinacidiphila bryophytorum TaxID=1436133 RepID=A0A9W4GYK6_9ACTN|nr:putative Alcohol dehydrogenase [Actinacidiphila bryophytorum]
MSSAPRTPLRCCRSICTCRTGAGRWGRRMREGETRGFRGHRRTASAGPAGAGAGQLGERQAAGRHVHGAEPAARHQVGGRHGRGRRRRPPADDRTGTAADLQRRQARHRPDRALRLGRRQRPVRRDDRLAGPGRPPDGPAAERAERPARHQDPLPEPGHGHRHRPHRGQPTGHQPALPERAGDHRPADRHEPRVRHRPAAHHDAAAGQHQPRVRQQPARRYAAPRGRDEPDPPAAAHQPRPDVTGDPPCR